MARNKSVSRSVSVPQTLSLLIVALCLLPACRLLRGGQGDCSFDEVDGRRVTGPTMLPAKFFRFLCESLEASSKEKKVALQPLTEACNASGNEESEECKALEKCAAAFHANPVELVCDLDGFSAPIQNVMAAHKSGRGRSVPASEKIIEACGGHSNDNDDCVHEFEVDLRPVQEESFIAGDEPIFHLDAYLVCSKCGFSTLFTKYYLHNASSAAEALLKKELLKEEIAMFLRRWAGITPETLIH